MAYKAVTPVGSNNLRIREASVYTGLSVSRLQKLTSPKIAAIPSYKVGGCVLIAKEDLDAFLATKRRYSRQEIDEKATTYVSTHKQSRI